MEVFSAVYRAELKRFGIDVVVATAGNMRTGAPAKTAAALTRVADGMTPEQRALYGPSFDTFATTLNAMQSSGLDPVSAAARVIELAEQVPAPSRAPVDQDAEEMLRAAREKSDAELDALRLQIVGLGEHGAASVSTSLNSVAPAKSYTICATRLKPASVSCWKRSAVPASHACARIGPARSAMCPGTCTSRRPAWRHGATAPTRAS
jgi:hypothetical protein